MYLHVQGINGNIRYVQFKKYSLNVFSKNGGEKLKFCRDPKARFNRVGEGINYKKRYGTKYMLGEIIDEK